MASVRDVLTDDQLREFAARGFLVVPGVVPEELLLAAEAEADERMALDPPPPGHTGKFDYFLPPADLPAADLALRSSPALGIAEGLVAPHRLDHALDHIQLSVNIPWWTHIPGGPHIDGHRPEQDHPHTFTLLAGIYLSDETKVHTGNLWVWPGSHRDHEALFRERGNGALLATGGHATLLPDPPELATPGPVLACRGDLLLAHMMLGHNTSGNESDRIRRILYFRLACEGHEQRWEQTFQDCFTEYEPVRAACTTQGSALGHDG